ncbi:TPA: DEAD/DEAH box helicase [Vibrio parahaemolyticus]|nr:DEAD/DEAH box helicase [Vibrio parahaemolyticus]
MSAQADVLATEHNDVVLVKTDKPSPFDQFYIVKHGKVNLENCADLPILKVKLASQIHSLNEKTELAWVRHPLAFFSEFTPEQITENWIGKFQFQAEDIVHNISGLRTPQIGALHAISAEFSRSTNIEPCTVVLPTGTGKTETMLSTTIYHRCQTVLVLVPSNSLRDQIGDKFKTLGCLPELGVVAGDILFPAVTKIKRGIKSVSEAKELLSKSNVVIATPQILNSKFSTPEVLTTICESCSHLFVDEAHHISAQKWSEIRDKFKGKRVVQFTATPFRNDTQSLGARIIYNYTMSEAQQAGYFTSVQLEPVEEYFENNMDKAIAEKALTILTQDRKNGFDHLMMARTKTKERAQAVYALYRKLAPELNPVLVYSTLSKTEQNRRLNELKSKKAKIVVCVDMLGEGYDLPNLKIAAIHDHHKSLAITLQFIGRFTRVSSKENLGTASAVVNIADPGIEGALQKLYAIDADWDAVLRRLSENQIEREVRLQVWCSE